MNRGDQVVVFRKRLSNQALELGLAIVAGQVLPRVIDQLGPAILLERIQDALLLRRFPAVEPDDLALVALVEAEWNAEAIGVLDRHAKLLKQKAEKATGLEWEGALLSTTTAHLR